MSAQISPAERRAAVLREMTSGPLDVLVVGGGIVGAGVARDAALRGLRVGLVEQHDLAFGTSSRSSRLLHGGLRYLAQGRLRLVAEASREKRVLHRIAPHLAQPLAFVFPTYSGTRWPLWQLRIGVKLYDLLCGGRNLGPSRPMRRSEIMQLLPGLNSAGLTGGVRYYDGLTNDARLVLDTLRSAARHAALVCNYARLDDASPGQGVWQCRIQDVLADQPLALAARVVVNATGPWAASLPHAGIGLRLTKGVHLVIDHSRLPLPDAVVIAEGSRILFAIPWGQRVILGTTDTDYQGPAEAVRTEEADIAYILAAVGAAFPEAALCRADVQSTWAGLRPLIADRRGRPSDISRRHEIGMPEPGWFDIAGGKLTTYRLIAEQAVDRLGRYLHRKLPRCETAAEPLLPAEEIGASGILPPPISADVVRQACEQEWAVHLDDVLIRRTGWHYYHAGANQIARQAAAWMADLLAWDAGRQNAELDRYRQGLGS